MSEVTEPVEETGTTEAEVEVEEPRIPRSRLNEEAAKRKTAEKELAEARRLLEERETAGLPELEQLRKKAEQAEKRAAEAERIAEERDRQVLNTRREQWISQAAASMDFVNPARAARLIDGLDDIETAEQAEKAVKRLAKSDPYLVKDQDKPLPGRVLENGRKTEQRTAGIDQTAEAELVADSLRQFLASRNK